MSILSANSPILGPCKFIDMWAKFCSWPNCDLLELCAAAIAENPRSAIAFPVEKTIKNNTKNAHAFIRKATTKPRQGKKKRGRQEKGSEYKRGREEGS